MKKGKWSEKKIDLDLAAFLSETLIGDCPNCGSPNVHDCEAEEYDCPVAKEVDDPCVGHCDDCGYLWCLECGNELTLDNPICGHWKICEECMKENEFLPMDEFADKFCTKCEFRNEESCFDCPHAEYSCPYGECAYKCPTVKKWLKSKKKLITRR